MLRLCKIIGIYASISLVIAPAQAQDCDSLYDQWLLAQNRLEEARQEFLSFQGEYNRQWTIIENLASQQSQACQSNYVCIQEVDQGRLMALQELEDRYTELFNKEDELSWEEFLASFAYSTNCD